jgi:hypothetical protein
MNALVTGFCQSSRVTGINLFDTRIPRDLLPEREAETFQTWLLAHHTGNPFVCLLRSVRSVSRVIETHPVHPQHASLVSCMLSTGPPGFSPTSRSMRCQALFLPVVKTWGADHEPRSWGAYAEGASQGAPHAQQGADWWHLLANLSETMKGVFLTTHAQRKAVVQQPAEDPTAEEAKQQDPWQSSLRPYLKAKGQQLHQERVTRSEQIRELHATKVDVGTIAHKRGVSRQCVSASVHRHQPPEHTHMSPPRQPILEPDKASLVRRWNERWRNAQHVSRERQAVGDRHVGRFSGHVRPRVHQSGICSQGDPATHIPVHPPPKRPPSASQVAHGITWKDEQQLEWQRKDLIRLGEADTAQPFERDHHPSTTRQQDATPGHIRIRDSAAASPSGEWLA